MGNVSLPNCYRFPYLGILFCGDGDTEHNWEVRRARASARFYALSEVWDDPSLSQHTKLSLYRSLVVSVLIYGYEAWVLNEAHLRSVNGFNSRCLARITNREIREEARDPTYNLCLFLRSQRLRFLGHVLRLDPDSMLRKVIVSRGCEHHPGDLFMDAPVHDSIEELATIASDRTQWRLHVEELAGNGKFQMQKANTAAETAAEIEALPPDTILAYTDGGCDGNGAGGVWGAAGWGAWIAQKMTSRSLLHTRSGNLLPLADLWGPVPTDETDDFFCGCSVASNNTGELTGMLNALLWARRQGGDEAFAICYDSVYAKNVTTGFWKPRKNKGIAKMCADALKAECERRDGGVHFVHVKGHSGDVGNDKADDRVQWGKAEGPYCRFRADGTWEGSFVDTAVSPSTVPVCYTPSPSLRLSANFSHNLSSGSITGLQPKARRNLFPAPSLSPISPIPQSTTISISTIATPELSQSLVPSQLEQSGCNSLGTTCVSTRNYSHNTRSRSLYLSTTNNKE